MPKMASKMAKSMALKWYAHVKTGQLKVQFLDVSIFWMTGIQIKAVYPIIFCRLMHQESQKYN